MTTFAGKTIPPIFRGGGLGPSFSTLPFILRDALYSYDGVNAVRNSIVWTATGVTLETIVSPDLAQTPINTVPLQYHSSRPGTPPGGPVTLSVRLAANNGPEPFSFASGTVGTWLSLSTTRQWQIARPAAGTLVFNESVYEMAFSADLTTIMARATITIQYDRP